MFIPKLAGVHDILRILWFLNCCFFSSFSVNRKRKQNIHGKFRTPTDQELSVRWLCMVYCIVAPITISYTFMLWCATFELSFCILWTAINGYFWLPLMIIGIVATICIIEWVWWRWNKNQSLLSFTGYSNVKLASMLLSVFDPRSSLVKTINSTPVKLHNNRYIFVHLGCGDKNSQTIYNRL